MPVSTEHPLYLKMLPKWQRIRDVLEGEDKVKERGVVYLPKLTEQADEEYEAYKLRAQFFNATGRTHAGLLGLVFKADPEVTTPADLEALLEDITLTGMTMFGMAKHVTNEVLTTARFGLFADFDEVEKRPYLVGYTAEQITNWRTERKKGKQLVTMVTLKETISTTVAGDMFTLEDQVRYRVLVLEAPDVAANPDAPKIFKVRLYEKTAKQPAPVTNGMRAVNTNASDSELVSSMNRDGVPVQREDEWDITEVIPVVRGTPLPFIPFQFVGCTRNEAEPERPPLDDVACVNLSHYRSSADLEHGRHFTGLPTAWVAGFSDTDSKGNPRELKIGSGTAWISDRADAKAGFLEFTGQGLKALEVALEQKQAQMEVLGARLLEQQKKAAEAADTLRIRQAGESSVLSSIATTVSEALTAALRFMYFWQSGGQLEVDLTKLSVEMNTEFVDPSMTAGDLRELVAAWQAKAISHLTLLHNLKAAEVLPPDIDPEDEIGRIQDEAPPLTGNPLDLMEDGNVPGSQLEAQEAAAKAKAAREEAAAQAAAAKAAGGPPAKGRGFPPVKK